MTLYKLSPSDLTFTWDSCRYCFYMKVKHGILLRTVFPGIFTKMANLISVFYHGRPSQDIWPNLPAGTIKYRERYVRSAPLSIPGSASQCYFSGRFDAVIEFSDGSYGIVDYKTSDFRVEQTAFYMPQLTAYAWALEKPASNALSLSPISRLGLFVITPEAFERTPNGSMVFTNRLTWMDVPRDDDVFLGMLAQVLKVLDQPQPPDPAESCGVCAYRATMAEFLSK